MELRVAIYARVAAADQGVPRAIERQVEDLRAHARARGLTVTPQHVYRDDGVSGLRSQRPGLDRLRAAIARREVNLVLVAAPNRLARDELVLCQLLDACERVGCRVVFAPRP